MSRVDVVAMTFAKVYKLVADFRQVRLCGQDELKAILAKVFLAIFLASTCNATAANIREALIFSNSKAIGYVALGSLNCNSYRFTRSYFSVWGIWSFKEDVAALNCGPGQRIDHLAINSIRRMPTAELLVDKSAIYQKTRGRAKYYQDFVAGRLVDQLIVFSGFDGYQVVVRHRIGERSGYMAYRQFNANFEVSYGVHGVPIDPDSLSRNDEKIISFVRAILKVESPQSR